MMVSKIPHTQRTYEEEYAYFNIKTNMYQELYWKVSDIIKEINSKGSTSLAEKKEIAKRLIEEEQKLYETLAEKEKIVKLYENACDITLSKKEEIAKRSIEVLIPTGSYSVSVYEEECNEDEFEHRVHIILSENEWTVDLGIVFDNTNNKAVRLYCEGADCDIQIEYDEFGHPMLGYVEDPRESIEEYQQEHCAWIWKFDMGNKNPYKEQWIVGAFQTDQQTFDEYTEQFGIIDIENVMPELVDYIASLTVLNEESDDDKLEQFIAEDMLNCCTDLLPDGYDFDVHKGNESKAYRDGFCVTCSLNGREIYRTGVIERKDSVWVEAPKEQEPEPSRKRKAVDEPEA